MRDYSHQLVNWEEFKNFAANFFESFSDRAHAFLIHQNMPLSAAEIYALFGILIYQNAFTRYLKLCGLGFGDHPEIRDSLDQFAVRKYELDPLVEDVFLHLGFFHRHNEFNDAFDASGGQKSELKIRNMKSVKVQIPFPLLRRFGLDEYEQAILERLAFLLVNHSLLDGICSDILGSNHGIYNDIGALHLAKAIRNKNKIVLVQPGFIHLQAKFIHQVEYELAIASHYIGWGKGRQASNIYRLGSMYSSRPFDAIDHDDSALVLLPQIPRTIPRPFSYYWSHINDFYPIFEELIPKLQNIKAKHQSAAARCKHLDLNSYKQLFQARNIDLPLNGANVNVATEQLKPTKTVYTTYFSTAIVEGVYAGSNVQTTFSESSYLLNSLHQEDSRLLHANRTDQNLLKGYVEAYAKKTDPASFAKTLINIIK